MKLQWKSFFSGAAATALVLGLIGTAAATVGRQTANLDYQNIKVTLNDSPVSLTDANGKTVEPFAIEGTTYLPVRAVASALALDVAWDAGTSTVALSTGAQQTPSQQEVYITRTGSKYHYDGSCNGGTYWPVPLSTAQGMGLEPCAKCARNAAAAGSTGGPSIQAGVPFEIINGNQPFFQPAT